MSKNLGTIGYLKSFFELKEGPEFAVLLSAPWGSGKTWMIKKLINSYEDGSVKFIYISLNGVGSVDEIENEYFRLLNPILGSEKINIAGSILESAIKASTRIEVSKKIIKNLKGKFSNHDNYILVFDDLERCELTMQKILGHVNDLVEHKKAKVVIIANEKGIKDKDEYELIKEKLIGVTLKVEPDVKSAIDEFKNLPDLTHLFSRYNVSDLLIKIFDQSTYGNLRNIKQSLAGFSILSKEFDEAIIAKEDLFKQLLAIYVIFSTEIKSGRLDPERIATMQQDASVYSVKLVTGSKEVKAEDKPLLYSLQNKYSYVNFQDRVFTDEIWSLIFKEGYIKDDKLVEAIKSSHYFSDVNTPAWQKLWHMDELSDEEYSSTLDKLLKDLKEDKVNDLFVLLHISGMLLRLSSNKVLDMHPYNIKKEIISQIDRLFDKDLLPKINNSIYHIFNDSSYMGLAYQESNTSDFKEIQNYAQKKIREKYIESLSDAYEKLVKEMVNYPWVFYEKINYNSGTVGEFSEVPIFAERNHEKFAQLMLENPRSTRVIGLAFKERYTFEYSAKKVFDEIKWMDGLIKALEDQKMVIGRSISKLRISSVINYSLKPALESLKEYEAAESPKE
jgi:hypothetical protein